MKQEPVISDVAKLAGVSTATVSNALNGTKHVSAELRSRVNEAITKLQYQPNTIARSLKIRRSYRIGIMVPDITNPFFNEIVKYIEELVYGLGYQIMLCSSDNDPNREKKLLNGLISSRVDGIVNVAPRMTDAELLRPLAVPMIVLDRGRGKLPTTQPISFVCVDNYSGAVEVAEHFLAGGYDTYACLAGPVDKVPNAKVRLEGYLNTLEKHGISREQYKVLYGDFTFKSGMNLMEELLEIYDPVKRIAVFVSNDTMAWGAMEAVKSRGLKIPKHIGLVGFDNIYFSELLYPKLTTVENPRRELSEQAVEMLMGYLEDETELHGEQAMLKSSLIIRDSS